MSKSNGETYSSNPTDPRKSQHSSDQRREVKILLVPAGNGGPALAPLRRAGLRNCDRGGLCGSCGSLTIPVSTVYQKLG